MKRRPDATDPAAHNAKQLKDGMKSGVPPKESASGSAADTPHFSPASEKRGRKNGILKRPSSNSAHNLSLVSQNPVLSEESREHVAVPSIKEAIQSVSLKDLFKPQEQDSGFSLLGNLGFSGALSDFELEDLAIYEPDQYYSTFVEPVESSGPISIPASGQGAAVTFDPQTPLFFEIPPFARDAKGKMKGSKAKDIFDIAREERWFESGGFWKVQTDEEIERRWGETRSELLHKCKKRHRETVKQSRRRLGKSASRVNPMVVQI